MRITTTFEIAVRFLLHNLMQKHTFQFLNPSGSLGTATSLYTREAFSFCTIPTSMAGAAGADTAHVQSPDSLDESYRGISLGFSLRIRLAQTNYIYQV